MLCPIIIARLYSTHDVLQELNDISYWGTILLIVIILININNEILYKLNIGKQQDI